jgi:type II secretory pathway pseudopilin PulG
MKTRAGITLIETLVAIFIMAIGLLALLTLFPLGALSMAQAIKDQRVAEAGQQARALGDARSVRNDANVTPWFAKHPVTSTPLPPNWDFPSYPVFADPWGRSVGAPATVGTPAVVRRTVLAGVGNRMNSMRWCALQDELTFKSDGTPDTTTPGIVQREPHTTWAYWLKRPNNAVTNVVEMSVVVYSGRDLALSSRETLVPNSQADPTAVVIDKTDIRKGMWIVDVTTHDANSQTNPAEVLNAKKYGPVHGYWYRVVDVTETTNAGNDALQLELQPKPVVPMQRILIMEGVVEVFPNGTGWK